MSLRQLTRQPWPYVLGIAGLVTSALLGLGGTALDRLGMPVWIITLVLLLTVVWRPR